ncbi:MAG: type II toxin-antitoxin system Phd/YefM family antitoxin [Butyrivibrio sp.]|nr:type II toxin-antitoxin system Phd/YefM family antitoxin [Butyrivibrio sp.]
MIQIRPVSDLRNKFTEIEAVVNKGQPVYLTKNGYGTMVVMSIEQYSELTDNIEAKLDEADLEAESTEKRISHDDIFDNVRRRLNEKL